MIWKPHFGSPVSPEQDNFTILYFDGEGYKQDGFHYDSSDSTRTIFAAWLVEENNILEDFLTKKISLPPPQPSEEQPPFSPSIFLVSDIEES